MMPALIAAAPATPSPTPAPGSLGQFAQILASNETSTILLGGCLLATVLALFFFVRMRKQTARAKRYRSLAADAALAATVATAADSDLVDIVMGFVHRGIHPSVDDVLAERAHRGGGAT